MADDLANLDENEPVAGGPVHEGDDEIRKTRLHTKNWAAEEHSLNGPHKFLVGGNGTLPAAGFPGRLFVHSDEDILLRDTALAWNMINAVGLYRDYTAASFTLSAAYQTIATATITEVRAGARVIAYGSFNSAPSVASAYSLKLQVDGVDAVPEFFYAGVALVTNQMSGLVLVTGPNLGTSKAVTLQAKVNTGTPGAVDRHLVVAVL